ncbi:MAG: hypothetical protein AAGF71_00780 [Pseudomonadota bacterium]
MYYQVTGRELPPLRLWPQHILDEAIDLSVEFGVLILGQGKVTAKMLEAKSRSKFAMVQVLHDPRNRVKGVEFPSSMRFFHEIRSSSEDFSLVASEADEIRRKRIRLRARRMVAAAKADFERQQVGRRLVVDR